MCRDYDTISLESIEEMIMRREKQLYLNQHKNDIWQGKNGRWYTYVPLRDNSRKLLSKASERQLIDSIAAHYQDLELNPTIQELFDEWISYKLEIKDISFGTRDRYWSDFNRFIAPTKLVKRKIRSITEEDIDDLIRTTIRDNDITIKTFSGFRTILNGMFRYAKRKKYTNLSISSYLNDLDISKRAFKPTVRHKETDIFSTTEADRLTSYLYTHPTVENLGILLAFESGVRVGELAALKFSDISNNVLHVQRQEVVYKSRPGRMVSEVVEYTKTENGDRYIYLPEDCVTILTLLKLIVGDSDYIMWKNGHRISKKMFYEYLVKACEAIDIPKRSMHKIRRTYATMLIDANVEDSLIMEQMGHSDISTTRKYYYYCNKDNAYKRDQIQNAIRFNQV